MTKHQAEACVQKIKSGISNVRDEVYRLHEQRGWEALGYKSWRECVTAEFPQAERTLYRELTAARVEKNLSNWTNGERLAEAQTRELARLKDPELQRQVYAKAVETAPEGKPTARHIHELAAEHVPKREPRQAAPVDPDPDDHPAFSEPDPAQWWNCPACDRQYSVEGANQQGWIDRGFCDECEGEIETDGEDMVRFDAKSCISSLDAIFEDVRGEWPDDEPTTLIVEWLESKLTELRGAHPQ